MSSKIHDLNLICFFIQDEALSPQSQPSPLSVCSESSGFSEISSPPKKAAKRTNQVARGEAASATTCLLAIQLFSIFRHLITKTGKICYFCTTIWVCKTLGCRVLSEKSGDDLKKKRGPLRITYNCKCIFVFLSLGYLYEYRFLV